MEWEAYLDELERELAQQLGEEALSQARDLARVEAGELTLAQRLRAVSGELLVFTLRSGQVLRATVLRVGKDWLLGQVAGQNVMLPLAAIVQVRGLQRVRQDASLVERRLSFSASLRRLIGEEASLVTASGSGWKGVILGVWADHLDIRTEAGDVSIVLSQLDAIFGGVAR